MKAIHCLPLIEKSPLLETTLWEKKHLVDTYLYILRLYIFHDQYIKKMFIPFRWKPGQEQKWPAQQWHSTGAPKSSFTCA